MVASGQLWGTKFQIGRETIAGTAVAATRVIYFNSDGSLSRTQKAREQRFAVGRRDNRLGVTNGPVEAGGTVSFPMSASEILEPLAFTVQGGVTATTPTGATAGRQWVFKPSVTIDSATLQWDDAARQWHATGVQGDTFTIKGSVNDTNMVTVDLFATDVVQNALTGALTDRVPTFLEGWQTLIYVDTFGTVPGRSQIPGFLHSWNVPFNNQLGRWYAAGNTLSANRLTQGELDVTGTLTVDAYSAQAAAEFANWGNGVKKTIRLEFLGTRGSIEASVNEVQTVAFTGVPTGGTATVNILGQSVVLPFDANAAAVKVLIDAALAVLGTGYTVSVTGGPLPASTTVTFDGAGLAGRNIAQMTLTTNSLTGGTAPTAAFGTTTPGYWGGEMVQVDIPAAWSSFDLSGDTDGIRTYDLEFMSIYEPTTLAAMISYTCLNNRTALYA
jgi:hypothetical protein